MPEDGPPPAVYNKQADQRSWIAMNNFFDEIFTYRTAEPSPRRRARVPPPSLRRARVWIVRLRTILSENRFPLFGIML
jgi:hypothetical protein